MQSDSTARFDLLASSVEDIRTQLIALETSFEAENLISDEIVNLLKQRLNLSDYEERLERMESIRDAKLAELKESLDGVAGQLEKVSEKAEVAVKEAKAQANNFAKQKVDVLEARLGAVLKSFVSREDFNGKIEEVRQMAAKDVLDALRDQQTTKPKQLDCSDQSGPEGPRDQIVGPRSQTGPEGARDFTERNNLANSATQRPSPETKNQVDRSATQRQHHQHHPASVVTTGTTGSLDKPPVSDSPDGTSPDATRSDLSTPTSFRTLDSELSIPYTDTSVLWGKCFNLCDLFAWNPEARLLGQFVRGEKKKGIVIRLRNSPLISRVRVVLRNNLTTQYGYGYRIKASGSQRMDSSVVLADHSTDALQEEQLHKFQPLEIRYLAFEGVRKYRNGKAVSSGIDCVEITYLEFWFDERDVGRSSRIMIDKLA